MPIFKRLIARGYWAPAGDDGADGGGGNAAVDRGDEVKSPLDDAGKGDEKKEEDGAAGKEDTKTDDEDLETDDEDLETDEEKAEREKAEAEAAKKARIRIPKARFDEAQAKARAREQALLNEIDKLKGGKQASETQKAVSAMRKEIEDLQDKYEDLILDGKKEEARKVRKEVDAMREELSEYQSSVKADSARRAAIDEMSYNAVLAGLEAQYPALNPDNAEFDNDAAQEVGELMDAMVAKGAARSAALKKAVKYVLGNPPSTDDGAKGEDLSAKAKADRAEAARRKALDASKRQAPNSQDIGKDSDKLGKKGDGTIDVMKLSQAQFAKLTEEQLAVARGDVL